MRFRAGLVIGFATGFYAGAMAGHERYEQINRALAKVRRSDTFDTATDKAKAVVDLGVERAKDIVETTFSRDTPGADAVVATPAFPSGSDGVPMQTDGVAGRADAGG